MHNVRSPNQWWSSIALLHRSRNRGTNGTYLLHSRVHNSILGQKFHCAMVFPSQMLTRPKKIYLRRESHWNFLSIKDFMSDWRRHEKFQSSIGHFHTLKLVHNFTKQFSPSDLSVLFMVTVVRNVYRSNLHQYFLRLQKFSQQRKYG